GASKAAGKLRSEAIAVARADRAGRVSCSAPGPISGPMLARQHAEADRGLWLEHLPQKRYGEPEEIAAAVAFLLSPEAGYITGQTLSVDGGFSAAGILRKP